MGDVLPGALKSQHSVVKRKAFEYGNGVGYTAADFESQSARSPGREECQHRRVAHTECRYLRLIITTNWLCENTRRIIPKFSGICAPRGKFAVETELVVLTFLRPIKII